MVMRRRPVSLRDLQARADERNASEEQSLALIRRRATEYRSDPTPSHHRDLARAVRSSLRIQAGQ